EHRADPAEPALASDIFGEVGREVGAGEPGGQPFAPFANTVGQRIDPADQLAAGFGVRRILRKRHGNRRSARCRTGEIETASISVRIVQIPPPRPGRSCAPELWPFKVKTALNPA